MSIFTMHLPLLLASGSPRRKDFLTRLGLDFQCVQSGDESLPLPGEAPLNFASRAALEKALYARTQGTMHGGNAAVLSADTVVSLDGAIFGKPSCPAHALEMLQALNNRTHTVYSACCLLLPDASRLTCHAQADVSFWNVPEHALRAYAFGDEPADKAGAYAVQGQGAFLVRAVNGSINAVIGLPLVETVEMLIRGGVIA